MIQFEKLYTLYYTNTVQYKMKIKVIKARERVLTYEEKKALYESYKLKFKSPEWDSLFDLDYNAIEFKSFSMPALYLKECLKLLPNVFIVEHRLNSTALPSTIKMQLDFPTVILNSNAKIIRYAGIGDEINAIGLFIGSHDAPHNMMASQVLPITYYVPRDHGSMRLRYGKSAHVRVASTDIHLDAYDGPTALAAYKKIFRIAELSRVEARPAALFGEPRGIAPTPKTIAPSWAEGAVLLTKYITAEMRQYGNEQRSNVINTVLNLRNNRLRNIAQELFSMLLHELDDKQIKAVVSKYDKEQRMKNARIESPYSGLLEKIRDLDKRVAKRAYMAAKEIQRKSKAPPLENYICEHIIERITSNAREDEIAAKFGVSTNGAHVSCRECGEQIIILDETIFEFGERRYDASDYNEVLWKTVLAITKQLSASFTMNKNYYQAIYNMAIDAINNYESKLKKDKLMNDDVRSDYLHLMAGVYVHTVLIKQIIENPRHLKYNVEIRGGASSDKALNRLYGVAFALIKKQYTLSLARNNINDEFIKRALASARVELSGDLRISDADLADRSGQIIGDHPITHLLWKNSLINGIINAPYDVEAIWKDYGGFDEWMPPSNEDWNNNIKGEPTPWEIGFDMLARTWSDVIMERQRAMEHSAFEHYRAACLQPIGWVPNKMKHIVRAGNLGNVYDANGDELIFDRVIVKINGKAQIKTHDEILAMIGTTAYKTLSHIARKSSKAGITMGFGKSNAVVAGLEKKWAIEAFYRRYQFICPVQGVHEMKDDTCVKCGITADIAESRATSYYTKWKTSGAIEKVRGRFEASKKPKLPTVRSATGDANATFGKLAKIFDIHHNQLINLGLSDGIIYDEIVERRANPSVETTSVATHRVSRLSQYNMFMRRVILKIQHKTLEESLQSFRWSSDWIPEEIIPLYNATPKQELDNAQTILSKNLLKLADINKPLAKYVIDMIIVAEISASLFKRQAIKVNSGTSVDAITEDKKLEMFDELDGNPETSMNFDFDLIDEENLEGGQEM